MQYDFIGMIFYRTQFAQIVLINFDLIFCEDISAF